MIQKYTYGTPFETDAIVTSIPASEGTPAYGTISTENGFSFTYDMDDNDVVYGLGESNRGINKRGYVYESNCSDLICPLYSDFRAMVPPMQVAARNIGV